MWDWALPTSRRSDAAGTDERNPTLNANGLIYGAIQSSDILAVLDPRTNTTTEIKIPSNGPVLDANTPRVSVWGDEKIWQRQADPRSVAMDAQGTRVGDRTDSRAPAAAGVLQGRRDEQVREVLPDGRARAHRQIQLYDPKTKQFTLIDSCFAADHNMFDEHDALVFGQDNAVGWVDTVAFDKTHDARRLAGVVPGRGRYQRRRQDLHRLDRAQSSRSIRRRTTGSNSDATRLGSARPMAASGARASSHEDTDARAARARAPTRRCRARPRSINRHRRRAPLTYSGGVAVDSHGVVWQNWRGVHEIFSFDRRKCKVLNGPTATGQQCPEGWTVYTKPGPTFKGAAAILSTDMLYLTNIDHHNALGLGKDVLLGGDVNADSFFVLRPQNGQMQTLTLRVPYPLGFHRGTSAGRIDDPNAGWKGRGMWSSYSMYTPWHQEGGKGSRPKVVKFQMRPNPLAK